MKMTVTVWAKGFYASCETEVRTVQSGAGKIVHLLDEMPDEIDGEKLVDWKRVQVEFTR